MSDIDYVRNMTYEQYNSALKQRDAENERQAARMKALDEENGRLRAALREIADEESRAESWLSRDFVEIAKEALNGTAEG
jgi:hypothetical protein